MRDGATCAVRVCEEETTQYARKMNNDNGKTIYCVFIRRIIKTTVHTYIKLIQDTASKVSFD